MLLDTIQIDPRFTRTIILSRTLKTIRPTYPQGANNNPFPIINRPILKNISEDNNSHLIQTVMIDSQRLLVHCWPKISQLTVLNQLMDWILLTHISPKTLSRFLLCDNHPNYTFLSLILMNSLEQKFHHLIWVNKQYSILTKIIGHIFLNNNIINQIITNNHTQRVVIISHSHKFYLLWVKNTSHQILNNKSNKKLIEFILWLVYYFEFRKVS